MKYKPGSVLILDHVDEILSHFLKENGFEVIVDTTSSFEALHHSLHRYQGVLLRSRWTLNASFFEAAVQLLFIGRLGVGIEHIDEDCAAQRGVQILTTPEASKDTVAEHTLGLILMLLNQLGKADREIRRNIWERKTNSGIELKGKTVGILGFGNMGRAVAQRLSGFEVTMMFCDPLPISSIPSYIKQVNEETLFRETDLLSIHIPLNEKNKNFVDYSYLSSFKKNLFIINTARGGVLDTDALVRHLKEGKVRGAALDVIEYEEQSFNELSIASLPPAFQYLKTSEQVVLNPHLAGLSVEVNAKHALVMARKIAQLFNLEVHVS